MSAQNVFKRYWNHKGFYPLKFFLENLDATPQINYSLWCTTRNLKRSIINKPSLRDPNGNWARSDAKKMKAV